MDSQDFARKLRLLMTDKSITTADMAEITGLSRQSIRNYLNASSVPSISNAFKIADALDVTVDDLALTPIGELIS